MTNGLPPEKKKGLRSKRRNSDDSNSHGFKRSSGFPAIALRPIVSRVGRVFTRPTATATSVTLSDPEGAIAKGGHQRMLMLFLSLGQSETPRSLARAAGWCSKPEKPGTRAFAAQQGGFWCNPGAFPAQSWRVPGAFLAHSPCIPSAFAGLIFCSCNKALSA